MDTWYHIVNGLASGFASAFIAVLSTRDKVFWIRAHRPLLRLLAVICFLYLPYSVYRAALSVGEHTDLVTIRSESAGTETVRKLSVLSVNAEREEAPERDKQPVFIHIRTPEKVGTDAMWRYDLTGQAYFFAPVLDITWVGRLPSDHDASEITGGGVVVRDHGGEEVYELSADQYIGSDNHLYLRFGPVSRFLLNFHLDYQSGRLGERVDHNKAKFSMGFTETIERTF